MSLNHIIIQGRFCNDPELRSTQQGKKVVSFTLAVDRDYQKGEADFINCVAWNKTAEFVDQYFTKGQMAIVSGTLQIREWTDKEGNKRTSPEVVAERVHFCGKKQEPHEEEVDDGDPEDLPF